MLLGLGAPRGGLRDPDPDRVRPPGDERIMNVGVAVVELHVEASQSLKAKRGVVRAISQRLRNKFNVSVGEVGGQGTWQRATLGLSMTGSDEVGIRRALERAVGFIEDLHLAQVLASEIEVLRMPLEAEGPLPSDADADWPWNENLGAANAADDDDGES